MATPPFARAFVEPERQARLRVLLSKSQPFTYEALVKHTLTVLEDVHDEDGYTRMDPHRIHEINDGDYQGTLVYIISEQGYQPSSYFIMKVSYGSCSGCDTLQSIRDSDYSEVPTSSQVTQYMSLCLHLVQSIKRF